ncbi:MAG: hypothetical protein NW214_02715 [Pseudanabaenaceae cyanobacterium bins.39]|nr:hypothetical protein [Pseudanabaenaceae cyanobacterium bins.39]
MLHRIQQYTFNLGAIALTLGASAIAVSPSIAQTTSVPITGGSFSVNVTSAGAVTAGANAVTVLTPVGTATITSLTGTTPTTTSLTTTNGTLDIQGKSTGTVNFDVGSKANFTDADTTIKGTIDGVSVGNTPVTTPVNVSALTGDATVTGKIATGSSILVPNSSITAAPSDKTVIPITGGSFDVVSFIGGPTTDVKTSVLTPFGTAKFTKFTYATIENLSGASTIADNDALRATGKVSGTAAVSKTQISEFTDADIAVLGTVTASQNLGASVSVKGNITGGSIVVPTSTVTNLPATSNPDSIILVIANPKLLKLVKSDFRFISLSKFKYLTILVSNDSLLSYTESKPTKVGDSEPVNIGSNDATDATIFLSFKKINIFPVAQEVALSPVLLVGKIPPGQAKKQKVVLVGMGSRLIPGFGINVKVENDD